MTLEEFGAELTKSRIDAKISLADIASETRINLKFLEAIESGKFHLLPQTYVRAILKEYSSIVNIDVAETLKKYDDIRGLQTNKTPEAGNSKNNINQENDNKIIAPLRRNIAVIVFATIALAFILLVVLNQKKEANELVDEIPFERVIKESEAIKPIKTASDSNLIVKPIQKDSLRLEMTTIDSVWISILIDGHTTVEYLFAPNKKREWSAKDKFAITMGNVGGALFKLNGKDIGALGKRGAVLRNHVITEDLIK